MILILPYKEGMHVLFSMADKIQGQRKVRSLEEKHS